MSLKTALSAPANIEVNNGILTISEVNKESVIYSCFIEDILIQHPQFGKGEIIGFLKNKWIIDFSYSTSYQELPTKSLLHYLLN